MRVVGPAGGYGTLRVRVVWAGPGGSGAQVAVMGMEIRVSARHVALVVQTGQTARRGERHGPYSRSGPSVLWVRTDGRRRSAKRARGDFLVPCEPYDLKIVHAHIEV